MIVDLPIQYLSPQETDMLMERLRLIKTYQDETTLRIYYFKIVEPKNGCGTKRVLIYTEYMNRSLFDYLCALRSNPKFSLDVSEIVYVIRNVVKSCIALKSKSSLMKKWT